MWSRVLKEIEPKLNEREVPLRRLRTARSSLTRTKQDIAEEAAAILEQSYHEAAAIKEEAIAARQQAVNEGRAEGEARGYREGLARAEEQAAKLHGEAETAREEARQILEQAHNIYRETIKAAEAKIVELVMAVAAKVIGREIEQKPQVVVELTRQAIIQVTAGQAYTVYACPETAEILQQRRDELLAEAAPGARLQVIIDPALKGGGCRVETENGFIDAGIDTQLEAVKKILYSGVQA